MIIDAHQHFWIYDSVKHDWIDDSMAVIRKDFLPSELEKIYAENNIDGCIAVQAEQSLEETRFLLELSTENDFIKGVVGWVNLRAKNIESQLEQFSHEKKLVGYRHIVQEEADHNFLLRASFLNGVSMLEKHDYVYDILVFPHQLGAVLEFVKIFPNQKFVIDHIAKPYIKDGYFDGWAILMKEIAKCENVFCKLSGMITEADFKSWTPKQINPYIEHIINEFGTKRVLFGSDWPVCLVAGSYGQVINLVTDFISNLSSTEQKNIMGLNAKQFYNIE